MKTMIPRVRSRREGRDEIYPDFYVFSRDLYGLIWYVGFLVLTKLIYFINDDFFKQKKQHSKTDFLYIHLCIYIYKKQHIPISTIISAVLAMVPYLEDLLIKPG